jgi:Flp pilus assembly protein TadG
MSRQFGQRKRRGATTALVAVCAIILVAIVVGAIQLSMLLNSSQSIRNSVEAGALNIATHAPDLKTRPEAGNEQQFSDCVDSSGQVGMTNINRVWGKALLENLNAKEMLNNGQAGNSQGNAMNAYAGATALNDRLNGLLTNTGTLNGLFSALAPQSSNTSSTGNSNPNGLNNGSGSGSAPPEFKTAFVHRGEESNLSFDQSQIPPGAQVDLAAVEKGGSFLPGYHAIEVNGKQFVFVSFRNGEMPHLLSQEEFLANSSPLNGASIPNAFFASGNIKDSPTRASADAVANPQKKYKMAIPHGYVTIHLDKNKANWLVNSNKVAQSTYEYKAETQWEVKSYKVGCKSSLNGYASLGNEYTGTLFNAITALPGNHQPVFQKIAQRVSEIDSSFSAKGLESLLRKQQVIPGTYDYVIYPVYKTADATDPSLKIAPLDQVHESWFKQEVADGTEKTIATDHAKDDPNKSWGQVIGVWRLTKHEVDVNGKLNWTPGTGVKQCLGTLTVARTATINFEGNCP